MKTNNKNRRETVTPRASVLVESMRDIGYSLQTAVADIIDNSITAGARNIEFFESTHSETPEIGILDDGSGMSEDELLEAMRFGTKSPIEGRSEQDLGRFGLGLKTATFSQCRCLVVITKKDGIVSCATLDLDVISENDKWLVDFDADISNIRWSDKLGKNGTLVLWKKLDRLIDTKNEKKQK